MKLNTEVDRSTYIGSHDIAAIMGEHPFLSRMEVFMRKTGQMPDFETTEQMEWGLLNEPAILLKYVKKKHNLTPFQSNYFARHPKHEWMGGHADAINFDIKVGVDAKNIRFKGKEWGEPGTDQVPRYVLWQAHHFMTLFDFPVWDIAPLFSGCEHEIYTVERDQDISNSIIEIGQEFWEKHVKEGIAPDIDETEASRLYLRNKYPNHDDELRTASKDEAELMGNLRDAEAFKKSTQKDIDAMKNYLQEMIGKSKGLASSFGHITWKHQGGARRIDVEKLRKQFPNAAKSCTIQSTGGRVFRQNFDKRGE